MHSTAGSGASVLAVADGVGVRAAAVADGVGVGGVGVDGVGVDGVGVAVAGVAVAGVAALEGGCVAVRAAVATGEADGEGGSEVQASVPATTTTPASTSPAMVDFMRPILLQLPAGRAPLPGQPGGTPTVREMEHPAGLS